MMLSLPANMVQVCCRQVEDLPTFVPRLSSPDECAAKRDPAKSAHADVRRLDHLPAAQPGLCQDGILKISGLAESGLDVIWNMMLFHIT